MHQTLHYKTTRKKTVFHNTSHLKTSRESNLTLKMTFPLIFTASNKNNNEATPNQAVREELLAKDVKYVR